MTKIRKLTNSAVPQTRQHCDDAIKLLGDVERELTRRQAEMNDEIAAIKAQYETDAAVYKDKAEALRDGIATWCEANRTDLLKGGGKTALFGNGEVKWRHRPPSVSIRNTARVLEYLQNNGMNRFIRTKSEIDKDAIKANPAAVAGVSGISIKSAGEDIVIEPFETALEAAS